MDWQEYEKILMQKPGFKSAFEDTCHEYENIRKKIRASIKKQQVKNRNCKLGNRSRILRRF